MLPSILAKQLEKGIGDYLETTFPMTNEPFKGSVKNMLGTKDSLYHEPYIAVRLPFRVAEKMPTCFEAVHPAYLPYVHQQKAFERLTGNDGQSTLVATAQVPVKPNVSCTRSWNTAISIAENAALRRSFHFQSWSDPFCKASAGIFKTVP